MNKLIDILDKHGISDGRDPLWDKQSIQELEKSINAWVLERELRALREDRRANTIFWKAQIDKMLDKEIAVYENNLSRLR